MMTEELPKLLKDAIKQNRPNAEIITKQLINDATIFVDPTDNGIRIYGKWKNSYDFSVTKELFEIYDKIAGYVKKLN